jgi:putative tryptophan/tyrosine transport system substrate-binding protein
MRRRAFLGALGGMAAWPIAAYAQQPEQVRRVGVIMSTAADDPESEARLAAFVQALQRAGWRAGQNLRVDTRWVAGSAADVRSATQELLALSPEVVVAGGRAAVIVPEIRQAGRGISIVFAQAVDPVGSGYVARLTRPGGDATGFMQLEYTLSGKWLQLLKDIAPGTERVAVLREAGTAGVGQWAVIQAAASPLAVELTPVYTHSPAEIERGIAAFASEPNGGLIVAVSSTATAHRELIIALAAKHRLPAIFPYNYFAKGGGLASYGPDLVDQYRQAAGYVDRILRGEKPGDLPVQAPTKYELVINLKTVKALGLTVPPALLARADEVIE